MVFVWYQKLNSIVYKYCFILESYGSLTLNEERQLYDDLKSEGFDIKNINIILPNKKSNYGNLDKISIEYNIKLNIFSISKNNQKNIKICVTKYFYTKI